MKAYADSNFFTRLYLKGTDFETAMAMLSKTIETGRKLPITGLHRLEIFNALEFSAFLWKCGSLGRATPATVAAAQEKFREDCALKAGVYESVSLPSAELEQQFRELSLRHTARCGFRTYDILHVSAALLLGCDTLWTFDSKCADLAQREGLALF